MNFTKMHGAGNDFIVIESKDGEKDWSKLAVAMCHRRFGVGSDGIILVMPSKKADIRMRMFNPDGSEAEACGNGTRCLVKYAVEKGLVNAAKGQLTIETLGGVLKARTGLKSGMVSEIQVGLGKPRLDAADIPVILHPDDSSARQVKSMNTASITVDGRLLNLNFVSMGNPHAIYFTSKPVSEFPLAQIGPQVEHHAMFPRRTNFEVARVLNRKQIEVKVWERGAGETLACGTGACAVAVAAQLNVYVDSKVDIILPGGTLTVDWDGTGDVLLSSPAVTVFTGDWLEKPD